MADKSSKVGIFGSSWGGFEAVYASSNSNLKPVVGVAYYPPTDLQKWLEWTEVSREDFFQPYKERIQSATNGDFSSWSHEYLVANLETNFLFLHSVADTLVPIEQSIELANASEKVELFVLDFEKEQLSHGKEPDEDQIPLHYSLSTSLLMSSLVDDELVVFISKKSILKAEDVFSKSVLSRDNIKLFDVVEGRIVSKEELKLK